MNTLSPNIGQNATTNSPKIYRSRPVIARKITAFQELITLQRHRQSARQAADFLEVPNSTMQSWQKRCSSQKVPRELKEFFSTPVGADYLQRNILAVMKLMKCGPCGIRGMQEYLRLTQLDHFVASSEGALQDFWKRYEEAVLVYGEQQERKLASTMSRRKITVGLDELFRGRRPCLVAIEVVSNYILMEKFTEDRKTETWKKEIEHHLSHLDVEVTQVVSDLCGGIRSCAEKLGAEHIPDLFHAQQDISQGISAPLSSQESYAEKAFEKAGAEVARLQQKPRWIEREKSQLQKKEIEKAIEVRDRSKIDWEAKKARKETVRAAIRKLGEVHHPIDLATGEVQTAQKIVECFNNQFEEIQKSAQEAGLKEPNFSRLEKAKRAFDAIACYLNYYFFVFSAFIEGLLLEPEQERFFKEVVFPWSYFCLIWRRLPRKMKEETKKRLDDLRAKIRDGPWPEESKEAWIKSGKELAEMFQRSSSCVEGRNGFLSLSHHRFHRLNPKSLRVLTIMHNFGTRRPDGTTAAERFFGAKHESLFERLVAEVRIPGQPKNQHHSQKIGLAA